MATRRYMINAGQRDFEITEAVGAAVVTKNIELTVDFGALAALTPTLTGTQARLQVAQAVQLLSERIANGDWPPA